MRQSYNTFLQEETTSTVLCPADSYMEFHPTHIISLLPQKKETDNNRGSLITQVALRTSKEKILDKFCILILLAVYT